MSDARILVVEDEAPQRTLLAEILRTAGYQVAECGTAELAVELLERGSVDLVLSDWKLPGMDGMALFHQVHERWPETAILEPDAEVRPGHCINRNDEFRADGQASLPPRLACLMNCDPERADRNEHRGELGSDSQQFLPIEKDRNEVEQDQHYGISLRSTFA